jgi:hypothetical protein
MEPRPPRPRSPHPFETPTSAESSGISERLYPAPGDQTHYAGTDVEVPGAPLLPRRQRRQQGALRGIAIAAVVIAAVAALGWFFRDAVRGLVTPPPTPTTVALSQAQDPATASPAAATESGALPNALATVTPTVGAPAAATARPAATSLPARATEEAVVAQDESNGEISAETMPLLDLLPTQEQVPAGLVLANEAERSRAEVVTALGGTEEAAQLLEDWGWSGNAFREYVADASGVVPGGTTFLNVSVHRFADAESAANAMVFFSDQVIFGQGLQEVEPPAVGESARLLVGAPEGVPLAVLYAQEGPIMYRIGGSTSSAEGDPTADVLTVAADMIPGQTTGG